MNVRYSFRYGWISQIRAAEVTYTGQVGAAGYNALSQTVVAAGRPGAVVFARDAAEVTRYVEFAGLLGTVAYAVEKQWGDRHVEFTGRIGFIAGSAYVRPDISGGVSATFEEV